MQRHLNRTVLISAWHEEDEYALVWPAALALARQGYLQDVSVERQS